MLRRLASKLRSQNGVHAVLAVLVVVSVGVATVGAPIVYGGTTAAAAEPTAVESYDSISEADSELDPADDVYLNEDGSAVLAYEQDANVDQFELSMDVSEGLAYMLVADDVGNADEELKEGNFTAVLDERGLSGDGSLVIAQPEELSELTVTASGEITNETNQFEATASGAFEDDAAMPGSATATGHVTATADRLETSGTVSVDTGMSAGNEGDFLDVSVEETTAGYAVDVARERTVTDWSTEQWETREQAKQTLDEQYGNLAEEFGGTSEITIDHYNFEEGEFGQHRLELEFTVEYTGIENGLERKLADELTASETDLTRTEAEEIAASVSTLEIETLEFTMDQRGDSNDLEWDVALANYDELSLAMIDLVEASGVGNESMEESIADARTAIEAQQATDLEWTVEWDVTVDGTSTGPVRFDAEVKSDTENWGAYVDELEANGIETAGNVTFDLTAETDGEELAMDAEFEVEVEDLAKKAVDAWMESLQGDRMASSDAERVVAALSESELEVARIDADIEDGTVQVQAGAKVENMGAAADAVTGPTAVGGIATETVDNTTTMYVYVDDMGEVDTESANKSDLEHLAVVDDETTVHQAGEWDEEFPEVDSAGMADYLGVKLQQNAAGGADSDSVPGFGVGVGLASIAGLLTVLALRRRQ